jgi:hypothetical protein
MFSFSQAEHPATPPVSGANLMGDLEQALRAEAERSKRRKPNSAPWPPLAQPPQGPSEPSVARPTDAGRAEEKCDASATVPAILQVIAQIGTDPVFNTDLINQAMRSLGGNPDDKSKASSEMHHRIGAQVSQLFKQRRYIRNRDECGRFLVLPFPSDGVVPEGWDAWEGDRHGNITTRKAGVAGGSRKDAAWWADAWAKEMARHGAFLETYKAAIAQLEVEAARKEADAAQQRKDLAATKERIAALTPATPVTLPG